MILHLMFIIIIIIFKHKKTKPKAHCWHSYHIKTMNINHITQVRIRNIENGNKLNKELINIPPNRKLGPK